MKFFIDTANIEEIKDIAAWGVLDGATTNPSLISKEGRDFKIVVKEITEIVDGPISAEVNSYDCEGMVKEARELSKIHNNIVIKVPMTEEALKAIAILKGEGIKTNCTLIFSLNQALLAAKAGASYVSPFVGRIDDIGYDGLALINDIMTAFEVNCIETEVIAASIRTINHVNEVAKLGCDIATVPYKVFKQMLNHPLTDKGIAQFQKDWSKFEEKKAK